MDDLGLTVAEYSLFGSILTIGAMIGAIVSGQIADYIGRRGTMGFSEIFCLAGWLAIAFSKGAWWLDLGRLLVGCGMGLLSYVELYHVWYNFLVYFSFQNLQDGWQKLVERKSVKLPYSTLGGRMLISLQKLLRLESTQKPFNYFLKLVFLTYFNGNMLTHLLLELT